MNNSSVFGWKIINIEFFSSLYSSAHSLSFSSQWALVAFVIITGISNCTSNNTDLSNSANQTDEKLELSRVFYPDQFSTCKSIVSGWGQETLLTTVGEPHPPPASLSKIPKDKVLDGRFQSFYQLLSSQAWFHLQFNGGHSVPNDPIHHIVSLPTTAFQNELGKQKPKAGGKYFLKTRKDYFSRTN